MRTAAGFPAALAGCESLTLDQVSTSQSPQREQRCYGRSAYLLDCFNQQIVEVWEVLATVPGPSGGFC